MTVHLDGMASARIADDHHNHATESTHGVSEAHHSNKTGKDTRHRNRVKVKSIKSWEILLRCIWDYVTQIMKHAWYFSIAQVYIYTSQLISLLWTIFLLSTRSHFLCRVKLLFSVSYRHYWIVLVFSTTSTKFWEKNVLWHEIPFNVIK